ncbi:unnamed protein product [Adineta steineri]|uniref:Uncharacterized protein n=1 Tax=Adineta steineri TaxID=433720 RepID=A0A819E0J5_9BILA|nr:unnamed protein product [Adineta steineri]CAF3842103.1 unnamed protein product [Adineta steineri]
MNRISIVLDITKYLSTSRLNEAIYVNKLLLAVCKLLNVAGDEIIVQDVRQLTSNVLFALKANNFGIFLVKNTSRPGSRFGFGSDIRAINQDNLSYLSLLIPQQQQQSSHLLTSFNNAAQSTRITSNTNKRSSLLYGLFGRHSSKKRVPIVKQSLKTSQQENNKRIISGGDQVKLSSTKIIQIEQPYPSKHQYNKINQKNTNNEIKYSFQGLRYDFKQLTSTSSINSSEIKQSFKASTNDPPAIQDKSLASLSDAASMRLHTNEEKQNIQNAHTIIDIPKMKPTINTLDKTLFNPHQHKYNVQTPSYHYSKHLSAIEVLAKKYASSITPRNSTGLSWYSANHQTMNKTTLFSKRDSILKESQRIDSSSDSRDTSTSSNSSLSSSNTSTKRISNKTSSSSSTDSITSSSNSTISSSQTEQQITRPKNRHYNRNQNDNDDLIRIDLNSSTSRTSTSTSYTY